MFPQVEEYVCLKVIAMVQLEEDATLSYIHERYLNCLKSFTRLHFPNEPKRAENLLKKLPAVSAYFPWLKLPTHKFILTPAMWGCNGYSSFWVNPITDCLFFFFQIRHAASLILESKMFYVPFLLNTPYV